MDLFFRGRYYLLIEGFEGRGGRGGEDMVGRRREWRKGGGGGTVCECFGLNCSLAQGLDFGGGEVGGHLCVGLTWWGFRVRYDAYDRGL